MQTTSISVLIAEDDLFERRQMERYVGSLGFSARGVENGTDCLSALREAPVDILILDLFMPEIDGQAVLRALRKEPEHRPRLGIVVMSGLDDEYAIRETLETGAAVFLTKPILPDTLGNVLETMIRKNEGA